MTGQENGDLLIQVTVWAGLMVYDKDIACNILKHFYSCRWRILFKFSPLHLQSLRKALVRRVQKEVY